MKTIFFILGCVITAIKPILGKKYGSTTTVQAVPQVYVSIFIAVQRMIHLATFEHVNFLSLCKELVSSSNN